MAHHYFSSLLRRWLPSGRVGMAQIPDTDTTDHSLTRQEEALWVSEDGEPREGKFWQSFYSVFTLDLRSLCYMRIAVALVLLMDLIIRFSDLEAHYTDQGVLPLEALFRFLWNPVYLSVYTMASSWAMQTMIFALNLVCILCLLAGYRTRLFTVLCWIFLLSLHNRNPLIQQGGDDLLRLLLFWGIFLPWGYHFSVDSRRYDKSELPSQAYLSIAGFGYVCQIFYVYFFSALLKSSPEWNADFTALYYALSLEQIVTPFGHYIYQFGDLLKWITMITYYTELVLPFLLFVPFFNAYCRLAFVLVICMFHIGISMTLYVGLFPLISISSVVGLLPIVVHDRLLPKRKAWLERLNAFPSRLLERWAAWRDRRRIQETGSAYRYSYVPQEKPWVSALMLFFVAYTLFWNIGTLGNRVGVLEPVRWIGNLLRVDQHWGMFAPSVFKDDGWFVLLGRTVSGKEVDIAHPDEPVSYEKPAVVSDFFKNDRWRKFHENMLLVRNNHFRIYYCAYLTNQWNKKQRQPDNRIPNLKIIYMKEVSLPDYQVAPIKKEVLFECNTELP